MARVSDIAIDLGTSRVLIYMKGRGIQLNEPAVVAVDRDTRNIIAIGDEAEKMIGRTPSNILAISPLRTGAIVDFDLVSTMLKAFVSQVVGKHFFARPRAVMAVPSPLPKVL